MSTDKVLHVWGEPRATHSMSERRLVKCLRCGMAYRKSILHGFCRWQYVFAEEDRPMTITAEFDLTDEVKDVLSRSRCEGHSLFLPEQLERALYMRVDRVLTMLGGKWSRADKCHVFAVTARSVVAKAVKDGKVLDKKKTFQEFPTPPGVACTMVELLNPDLRPGVRVLEPSAGTGNLIVSLYSYCEAYGVPMPIVSAFEIQPELCRAIKRKPWGSAVTVVEGDFLKQRKTAIFDHVLMNPPFHGGQDIEHVRHAYDYLKPTGTMVACMSLSWKSSTQKKPSEFREWLAKRKHRIVEAPGGAFRESGTEVATVLVRIEKS